MGQASKIEWTDATWNPVRGCTRVSEGCRNCYAERQAVRQKASGYKGLVESTKAGPRWTGKIEFISKLLDEPMRWREPKKIFVNSMSDLFHESVPWDDLDWILTTMALCPQHTFQVLTKRPRRMQLYLNEAGTHLRVKTLVKEWPLPNVWWGTSVEDQETADERIPLLLATPAAVRFVSYEPALGPVDFRGKDAQSSALDAYEGDAKLDWLICGGESGPGARPMHPEWARSARDQCQAAGVPFFFKQWGEWAPTRAKRVVGVHTGGGIFLKSDGRYGCQADWWNGSAEAMDKLGKREAGRLLDGREWNEFPRLRQEAATARQAQVRSAGL